jgi:Uma2 family endonuclease
METVEEIRRAMERLPLADRLGIGRWLWDNLSTEGCTIAEAKLAYAPSDPPFMTLAEFFEFEEKSEIRHEYVDGVVFATTGASVAHERVRQRLVMAFGTHLSGGPCEVFPSGMQLLIQREASEICYYPDIMVDCRRDVWGKHFVRSPKVVVEVLSPSTQLIDRREKLQNYRLIDSVEEYVLAAQDKCKVTLYRRAEGWRPQVCVGTQALAEFRSIDLAMPLSEIYGDIVAG